MELAAIILVTGVCSFIMGYVYAHHVMINLIRDRLQNIVLQEVKSPERRV
jgi:hypothetical protein